MNLDNNLISKLSNIDLAIVLSHHGVTKASVQPYAEHTAYFCPFCKGSTIPHFHVSKGNHIGGLYASVAFSCKERNLSGYGAIELESLLSGKDGSGRDQLEVLHSLATMINMDADALKPKFKNGVTSLVESQPELSFELMDGFTPEGMKALGCNLNRLYSSERKSVKTSAGYIKQLTTKPLLTKDGAAAFAYSFGSNFDKKGIKESNFETKRLHAEFNLFQVKAYTTRGYWNGKQEVSLRRESHELFPIFAVVHKSKNKEGELCDWGQIIQPYWHDEPESRFNDPTFSFYTGGLNAFSVKHCLIGDNVYNLAVGGMTVPKAVKGVNTNEFLTLTKKIIEYDETAKKEDEKEVELSPKEVKVENMILCKDMLNAINVYYHTNGVKDTYNYIDNLKSAFYHVAWMMDYTADFTSYMFAEMCKVSINKYMLFDIDNYGKEKSFLISRRFPDMRAAFMPENLKQCIPMYIGGREVKCVDVYAFFQRYELDTNTSYSYDHDLNKMFLHDVVNAAIAVKPLEYFEKTDKKSGQLLDYYYKLNSSCLWQFMATEGFCREVEEGITEKGDVIGRFLKIDRPFVREIEKTSLIPSAIITLTNYAKTQARPCSRDFEKMSNAIVASRDMVPTGGVKLPLMDIDYRSGYGPQLDHFFYRNGALRITPTTIDFIPYSEISFHVDVDSVLPFDFELPCASGGEPFTITENPEYKKKVEAIEEHKRDVKKYSVAMIDMEERELSIWAQVNRWLFDFKGRKPFDWWQPLQVIRCFANEHFKLEDELIRQGKELTEDDEKEILGHMANIIYSLGRPLFRYKGGGTNYIPYVTENNVSSEGRSEGGSGKSVFSNIFMSCAGKVFRVNGRNMKPDSDINLFLSNYAHHSHRVIHWEDYAKGMPIDPLFNYATSGFQYRKRHRDEVTVPLKDSPGHIISSNFQQTMNDGSASGRIVPCGFSHRFTRGNVRKNIAERKISAVMPGLRDDPEDMEISLRSQIAYICALAVQFCMNTPTRVFPPMGDLNNRSRVAAMGENFVLWAENFFSKPCIYNCPVDIETLFEEYKELCETSEYKQDKFSIGTFKDKVKEYCSDINVEMTPDVCLNSATDKMKRYMRRKAWIRTVYFDDERTWGPGKKKVVRELRHSSKVAMFFKENDVPANYDGVKKLCEAYYNLGCDPDPILDGDGNPEILTEEEREKWDRHKAFQQKRNAPLSSPLQMDEIPTTGKVAASPELPF